MVTSEFGAHALKSPELPRVFQQSTFKSQTGERGCRELQEGEGQAGYLRADGLGLLPCQGQFPWVARL